MGNKIQKQQRIERIHELLGDGYPTYQIVNICAKEWSVSRRTIERYLTLVYNFLQKQLSQDDVEKLLLKYQRLALKYEKKGDAAMAFKYNDMINKMTSAYSPDRLDMSINLYKAKF